MKSKFTDSYLLHYAQWWIASPLSCFALRSQQLALPDCRQAAFLVFISSVDVGSQPLAQLSATWRGQWRSAEHHRVGSKTVVRHHCNWFSWAATFAPLSSKSPACSRIQMHIYAKKWRNSSKLMQTHLGGDWMNSVKPVLWPLTCHHYSPAHSCCEVGLSPSCFFYIWPSSHLQF